MCFEDDSVTGPRVPTVLVVIEGAGHEVTWDQPETSLAAIRVPHGLN